MRRQFVAFLVANVCYVLFKSQLQLYYLKPSTLTKTHILANYIYISNEFARLRVNMYIYNIHDSNM